MRTEHKTINIYTFSELGEKAKQKAIERLYDINVSHDWWDAVYADAERIGIAITSFYLDRHGSITGKCGIDVIKMLRNIVREHGGTCRAHETAKNALSDWQKNKRNMGEYDREDWQKDAFQSILDDYLAMLNEEYQYLTGEESIIETIEANEYEFTEGGRIY